LLTEMIGCDQRGRSTKENSRDSSAFAGAKVVVLKIAGFLRSRRSFRAAAAADFR